MALLKYIFLLFIGFNASAQTNASVYYRDTVPVTKFRSENNLLPLYFPLKKALADAQNSVNALDTFHNVWYSEMLASMKEPVLMNNNGDTAVYRFTWLRTFHKPIVVRTQKIKDSVVLIAKVLSGAGGYDPGEIIIDKTVKLELVNWDKIQTMATQINFWTLPVITDAGGFDGAEWILEGVTKNDYHFTTRWSPGESSAYGKFCLYLLSLSDIGLRQQKVY